ncbi:MAG: hypothetical protein U0350_31775 [Caldilineaceae bacterium]
MRPALYVVYPVASFKVPGTGLTSGWRNHTQLRRAVVAHAPPEERLAGLNQQELLLLLKQIEAYLQGQPPAPDDPAAAAGQA